MTPPPHASIRPPLVRAAQILLALAFAALTVVYALAWMLSNARATRPLQVELGVTLRTLVTRGASIADSVQAGSPARAAGLAAGDTVFAFDGRSTADPAVQPRVWWQAHPGDTVRVTIHRPGEPARRDLRAVFRARRADPDTTTAVSAGVGLIRSLFPIPFVLVGVTVLLLRPDALTVWLMAWIFGGFLAAPGFPQGSPGVSDVWLPWVNLYGSVTIGLLGPLVYLLYVRFPSHSPLDRRAPWLKWVGLAGGLVLGFGGLQVGEARVPGVLAAHLPEALAAAIPFWYEVAFLVLGLVAMALAYFRSAGADARRRIRVVFWGTAIGLGPALLETIVRRVVYFDEPEAVSALLLAMLSLFPLSFAYAILRHRALDIPVLLRRGARYLLVQRGAMVILSLVSVGLTVLFAMSFRDALRPARDAAEPLGIGLGAAFGGLLMWGGSAVQRRVRARVDRAFFRGAYDARRILEDLTRLTASATDRAGLAALLERHVGEALRPVALAVYLRSPGGQLATTGAGVPDAAREFDAEADWLTMRLGDAVAWEAPASAPRAPWCDTALEALAPECVVPMTGRDGRRVGLLVLGPRRSEEPYSGEDLRLLAAVARQAAVALDNMRLAEEIAGRMEADRRVAREMGIAREVQARLLPQRTPVLGTLDVAARCVQARAVGGDSYDFIELSPGRVAFVLADVSGKGIHAALLTANLQAHLRSQFSSTPGDPLRALRAVNHMLWRSTDPGHFATLFFGIYDDATRVFEYANCGHNPPALMRRDHTHAWLDATGTLVGAFEAWDCEIHRVTLGAGETLAIYSDGVTEAQRGEEQYGEERLVAALAPRVGLPAELVADALVEEVLAFSAGAQSDDLTLLVLVGR